MENILYLVVATPGAGAFSLIESATSEDSPLPNLYSNSSDQLGSKNEKAGSFDVENGNVSFSGVNMSTGQDHFVFLSNTTPLADQIEAFVKLIEEKQEISMGRILTFLDSNILPSPPHQFEEWVDAVSHFSDCMLFVNRTNENASAIQRVIDRYGNMHYPMETFILGKKNNPWSRILDPTPRRLSHVFDAPELLDSEDLPENDRFLAKIATGDRKHRIPLPFAQ